MGELSRQELSAACVGAVVSKHPGPPLQGNEVVSRTENALPGRGLPQSFPFPSSHALGSKLQNLPPLQNVLPENILWIKTDAVP